MSDDDVFRDTGAKVGHRDIIGQVLSDDEGAGLGRHTQGHVGAGALAPAVGAEGRRYEQGPALNRGEVELALV